MFARSSTWKGSPEQLERWARTAAEKVKPFVQQQPGNVGAYFLIDRDNGTGLTLTLWESEEAALATDAAADKSRDRTIDAAEVTLVAKGRYEVVARI